MDIEEAKVQFKVLSAKCQDIRISNRKLLDDESKPKVYSLKDEGELEKNGDIDDEVTKNIKLMNTTLREFETQELRNGLKQRNEDVKGDRTAKLTYDKDLKMIKKDNNIKYKNNIDKLVNHLNLVSKKRYQVTKKKLNRQSGLGGDDGFISERNKQFNAKLDRERKKD